MNLEIRSESKEGACVYCGAVGALTKDHVPPKNLFPKPRLGLVTVPSCEPCNGSYKLDDEYFRLAISTSADAKKFPIALEAISNLGAPEKIRFALNMLWNIDPETGALYVDPPRVRRVIERVIRGLFWHHQRRPLPAQADMRVWFTCFGEAPLDDMGFEGLLNALGQQNLHQIGNGIFSYRYTFDSAQAGLSAWYLRFYETNEVLGVVVPLSTRVSFSGENYEFR